MRKPQIERCPCCNVVCKTIIEGTPTTVDPVSVVQHGPNGELTHAVLLWRCCVCNCTWLHGQSFSAAVLPAIDEEGPRERQRPGRPDKNESTDLRLPAAARPNAERIAIGPVHRARSDGGSDTVAWYCRRCREQGVEVQTDEEGFVTGSQCPNCGLVIGRIPTE